MTLVVIILCLALVLILIWVFTKTPVTTRNKWQHFFADYQLPAEDFYRQVREKLEALQLPGVKFAQEQFFEKHLLSARRNYLTITRNEFVFFIGSAHFGTGSFVSWWFTEEVEGPLNRIPVISKWFLGRDRDRKTFYQMDSEAMFRDAVHSVFIDTLEDMTGGRVQRPLLESERKYVAVA